MEEFKTLQESLFTAHLLDQSGHIVRGIAATKNSMIRKFVEGKGKKRNGKRKKKVGTHKLYVQVLVS